MTPQMKRLAFTLRAPRAITLTWTPWHAFAAAVHGYHQVFFAVLGERHA